MEICILGNSHSAAIKYGWDKFGKKTLECNVTFFASDGRNLQKGLKINSDLLLPNNIQLTKQIKLSSKGCKFIDTKKFDIIVVYGWTTPFFLNYNYYSKNVMIAAMENFYNDCGSYSLIKTIRKISNKKIFLGMRPNPVKRKLEKPKKSNLKYNEMIKLSSELFFDKFNCILIPQPISTIFDERYTKEKYSLQALKFQDIDGSINYHPERDLLHMNADFGLEWWKSNYQYFVNRK